MTTAGLPPEAATPRLPTVKAEQFESAVWRYVRCKSLARDRDPTPHFGHNFERSSSMKDADYRQDFRIRQRPPGCFPRPLVAHRTGATDRSKVQNGRAASVWVLPPCGSPQPPLLMRPCGASK